MQKSTKELSFPRRELENLVYNGIFPLMFYIENCFLYKIINLDDWMGVAPKNIMINSYIENFENKIYLIY